MSASLLFEAEPMVHPNVLEAYEKAIRVLRKARIPYRETGGIALNFYGAGRPIKDVDLIVRRTDWLRAIRALGRIATYQPGIRFGLAGEPESGRAGGWTIRRPHRSLAGRNDPRSDRQDQRDAKSASASCWEAGLHDARRRCGRVGE